MNLNIPSTDLPRVVIVGGGFGGLQLAKHLHHDEYQVVLIDKNNYHTFQPLLYQVATSGLEAGSIGYPLRKLFKEKQNFHFRLTEVEQVVPEKKLLVTSIGDLEYDVLVLATGSTTNFFGNEKVQQHAMAMKSIPEALDLRSMILQNLEKALLANDVRVRENLMNFVIVGAGPTGVELAGALAELKKHVLPADYPDMDIRRMQIHIFEGSDRVLPPMSKNASEKALKFLKKLRVNVWLNTIVQDFDGENIITNTGKVLKAHTLIWTAGVKAQLITGVPAKNRIEVNRYNQVIGYDNIYALGDVALMVTEKYPKGHPMVAQPAIQQGKLLAVNLHRMARKKSMKKFEYRDKGSMATIGRNKAVVDLPRFRFQGAFAWFVWMFVHLISLVGFKNKIVIFVSWVWNYLIYDQSSRLIIRPYKKITTNPLNDKKSINDLKT